jgi:hypothetical protein
MKPSSWHTNEGKYFNVTSDHITSALKLVAKALEYPILKGIPIECINTHLLRSGGANALALAGYSDTQIQKNVKAAWGHFQGVCPEQTCVFLIWYVLGHKTKI